MPQFPQFLEMEEGTVPWGRGCAFGTLLCREGVSVGCTSCCWAHRDHKQPCLSLAGCFSSLLLPSQFPSHRPLTRLQRGPLSQQTLQE